jgi:hypothetical protein
MFRFAMFVLGGGVVVGCAAPAERAAEPPAAPSASSSATAPSPAADPADFPSVSPHAVARGPEATVTTTGATISTSTFAFDLPAAWRKEQPSSSMRLAQAVVPGAAGPGELAVFYFGPGQGGTVEGNFERWMGQMEVAAGAQPKRDTFEANGFKISWIDLSGTLLPSSMGSGPTVAQPGFRLIGAVVEGGSGPYFFKLTGPEATLAAERDAFLALLRSSRPTI